MPAAHGGASKKYWLMDHEPAEVILASPVTDVWYPVLTESDVRLLLFSIMQINDDEAVKDIEVRWTLDGNVYTVEIQNAENGAQYYIAKDKHSSVVGGLDNNIDLISCGGKILDKRALEAKLEIRITSACGTNQMLIGACLYETLEET